MKFKLPLWSQILIAMILAVIAGSFAGKSSAIFGIRWIDAFNFAGNLFLQALKMVVVPLIASSIISSIASMSGTKGFARLGIKTISFYFITVITAVLLGLFLVNLIRPGDISPEIAKKLLSESQTQIAEVQSKISNRGAEDIVGIFLRMFPSNIVDAASNNGEMLGVITFSILFGFFCTRLKNPHADVMKHFWRGFNDVMISITEWIMKFAPIGVFGLVAKVAATTSLSEMGFLIKFFLTVSVGLLIHSIITLPLLMFLTARINPIRHYKAFLPALLTAFSTSSSSATTPVTMDCAEKNAGISNRVTSFVIPLGATVNMDGTALYECVVAMFLAQVYGLEITLATQFVVVMLALLTSIGVAGIPAASLVAIVVILESIGVPTEYLGLVMIFDRILDMMRTTVNVLGDTCCASIIARSEGEKNVLAS